MTTIQEIELANWVSACVKQTYRLNTGAATARDGNDDSGLTVDFTFEASEPRIALEVTRLRADFERPDKKALRRLEERLVSFATSKGWPNWFVGIRPETKLKSSLGPSVERIIDWMLAAKLESLGPAFYSHDVPLDLLQRMGSRFMQDCEAARLAGVVLVRRESANGITVFPVSEWSDSKSLHRPLTRVFERKASALSVAKGRGYVTMLAVDTERQDARDYLREGIKVRDFPQAIDHLWVLLRGLSGGEMDTAFHARRDTPRLKRVLVPNDPEARRSSA